MDSLFIAIFILALISILLTSIICIYSFCSHNKKSSSFPFVVNLCIMATLHTSSYIINWIDKDSKTLLFSKYVCSVQSVILLWSSMTQEMWITAIVIFSFINFNKAKSNQPLLHLSTLSTCLTIAICNSIPLITVIIYNVIGVMGESTFYCWVALEHEIYAIIVYSYKWVHMFIDATLAFIICHSIFHIRFSNQDDKNSMIYYGIKLMIYPLLQIINAVLFSISRVGQWTDKKWPAISVISLLFGAAQGIIFPLIFGISSRIFVCSKDRAVESKYLLLSNNNRLSGIEFEESNTSISINNSTCE